jgi:hypothetical protein
LRSAAKELTCRHSPIISSNYFCTFNYFIYFTQHCREDWKEDLHKHAKQLGFGDGPDSVLAMLKTFPMTVQEEYGQIKLKPIPCEGTKENLALIDKSNEEKAERKRKRERMRDQANQH